MVSSEAPRISDIESRLNVADAPKSLLDKFKKAARQFESNDDPARFKEPVGAEHKPVEKPGDLAADQ